MARGDKKVAAAEEAVGRARKAATAARAKAEAIKKTAVSIIGEERARMATTPLFAAGGGVVSGALEGAGLAFDVAGFDVSMGAVPGVIMSVAGPAMQNRMVTEVGSGMVAGTAHSIGRQFVADLYGG